MRFIVKFNKLSLVFFVMDLLFCMNTNLLLSFIDIATSMRFINLLTCLLTCRCLGGEQVKVWFQNRRTKNRRTVDELRPSESEVEPSRAISESSDDSCGDSASRGTSCTTTTAEPVSSCGPTSTPEVVEHRRRHVTAAVTSHGDDEDKDGDVYIDNHGNRPPAGVSGWSDLCRGQTLSYGLASMSTYPAAVTIGQS